MINFLKLLNFELHRFIKLYTGLLVFVAVFQIAGTIVIAKSYMNRANRAIKEGGFTQSEFIMDYDKFGMEYVLYSLWFIGPIAIGVVAILFYLFFIWYRDWFAKNTFIYRLLTLPTSRMNVYVAKVSTIMLTVLGLVAYQLILLKVEIHVMKWIVPKAYRYDNSIPELIANSQFLPIILPKGFAEFLIAYGIGLLFVIVLFTMILFERSYRWKGIIIGIMYAVFSILLFTAPISFQYVVLQRFYLYPSELVIVQVVMWFIVVGCSLVLSRYLLNHKVSV